MLPPATIAPRSAPTLLSLPDAAPPAADRHLLRRFSWGVTPQLADESAAHGGARGWFDWQLDPDAIPDPAADAAEGWWPNLNWSAERKVEAAESEELPIWRQDDDLGTYVLNRRHVSSRQLREVMADFWGNLLYVARTNKSFMHLPDYERTIRAHALGTFEELLQAAILHPCMLLFLDNASSTDANPNENLGREVLELYSVTPSAEFTEDDVKNSMWILTGWRVGPESDWERYYDSAGHHVGPVRVLDFRDPNPSPDGQALTLRYLSYLAKHRDTALHVARRLAIRFVSDEPSDELVEHLADVYQDSGTDTKTVLRALIGSAEFAESTRSKVCTPIEDVINTYRVLGVGFKRPNGQPDYGANALNQAVIRLGQKPRDWPRPDGFPDTGERWSASSRMLASWQVHNQASLGSWPKSGVTYQSDRYFYGQLPATFATVVDRVSQIILGQPATESTLQAAELAVDCVRTEQITSDHKLIRFRFPVLLLAVLDSPDHMRR